MSRKGGDKEQTDIISSRSLDEGSSSDNQIK